MGGRRLTPDLTNLITSAIGDVVAYRALIRNIHCGDSISALGVQEKRYRMHRDGKIILVVS